MSAPIRVARIVFCWPAHHANHFLARHSFPDARDQASTRDADAECLG
jgi:hypothetical protein